MAMTVRFQVGWTDPEDLGPNGEPSISMGYGDTLGEALENYIIGVETHAQVRALERQALDDDPDGSWNDE